MRLKWDSDTGPYPRLEFVDFYLGIINVKILGFKLFEKISGLNSNGSDLFCEYYF